MKEKTELDKTGAISISPSDRHKKAVLIFMIFLSVILTAGALLGMGLFLKLDQYQLLRNTVIGVMSILLTVFLWLQGGITNHLSFDNAEHPVRFFLLYDIGLVLATIFSRLPETVWVFLFFFIFLSLLSNPFTGLSAAGTLLICTMFLSSTLSFPVFLTYFVSGMIGIVLFQYIDEHLKFGIPVFLSLLMQLICIFANQVLFQSKSLTLESCILPLVNILINCLLLFLFLQTFTYKVVLPKKNIYQIINDPEYQLMTHIRESSRKDFFHSVHTAYLTERICSELSLDVPAAKTAAYYYKTEPLLKEFGSLTVIMKAHHFPDYAVRIIQQLRKVNNDPLEKESTVVMFCDNMITTLEYLADQNKELGSQYETIVNTVLDKRIEKGVLNHSKISIMEMNSLRKKILEEKLYYDFIRIDRSR